MNSKYSGSMGTQRLIKLIKSSGGPPGPDTIGTSQIINNSIGTADIADGAITEAKFSAALQLALATFTQQISNLESPGWYGNFKIKNSNTSNPYTFTFSVFYDTFNDVTDTTDTIAQGDPVTLTHNTHYDLVIPIGSRLTNKDTIIRLQYTGSSGSVILGTPSVVGLGIDDVTSTTVLLVVSKPYIHNGNIEITVILD
jgi:hypothetical protein